VSSVEPEDQANQLDCGEECAGELVISCGDGAELFELVEESFDEVALAIQGKVRVSRLGTVGLGWNDGHNPPLFKCVDQGVCIIGFIGQERLGFDLIEQRPGLADIGGLARCERQRNRIAKGIDDGMDLGCQPAAGPANGLILPFFFWAPALCW